MTSTATGFEVREHRDLDHLDDVDAAWIDRSGFYTSLGWTRSQDDDRGFDTRYLTVHDGRSSRPCALVPFHRHAGGDSNPLYNESTVLSGERTGQVLAGSRTGYDNRLLLHPDLGSAERRAVLAQVNEVLLDRAREAGVGHVSWWYLPADQARELQDALRRPTVDAPCLPTAVARLTGSSFEEHVAALHKSRRARVRYERKQIHAAGFRSHTAPADPDHLDRWAPLIVQVQRRHGEDLTHDGAVRYLRRCLGSGLGPGAVMTEVLDAGGALAACTLSMVAGGVLHVRAFGCDHDAGHGQSGEYFEATVYGPMDHAFAHGLTALHMGVTAYRAKTLRGAELQERRVVVVAPGAEDLPRPEPAWGFLGDDERYVTGTGDAPC